MRLLHDLSLLHLKRASETQNHAPRDRRLHEILECETCACVIHTNLYTLSALLLSSYINVCAGYMCFVKLY